MNEQTKAARIAEMFGISADIIPEVIVPVETKEQKSKAAISREAEAILFYIYNPNRFTQKECLNCGGVFAVNRSCIGYCSDTCRAHALKAVGILWNPFKDESERYDFREPLVVPPRVLEHLEPYVQPEPVVVEAPTLVTPTDPQVDMTPVDVDSLLANLGL